MSPLIETAIKIAWDHYAMRDEIEELYDLTWDIRLEARGLKTFGDWAEYFKLEDERFTAKETHRFNQTLTERQGKTYKIYRSSGYDSDSEKLVPLVQKEFDVDVLEAHLMLSAVYSLAVKFRCTLWLEGALGREIGTEETKALYGDPAKYQSLFDAVKNKKMSRASDGGELEKATASIAEKIFRRTHEFQQKMVSMAFKLDEDIKEFQQKKREAMAKVIHKST